MNWREAAEAEAALEDAFGYSLGRVADLSRLWDAVALWVALDHLSGWQRESLLVEGACHERQRLGERERLAIPTTAGEGDGGGDT
jgi:hypothetical protein